MLIEPFKYVSQYHLNYTCMSFYHSVVNRELIKRETFLNHERQPEVISNLKVTSQVTDLRSRRQTEVLPSVLELQKLEKTRGSKLPILGRMS